MKERKQLKAPSIFKSILELRAFIEALFYLLSIPLWSFTAKGDGHPVLVIPGYLAGDWTTKLLRIFLNFRGYKSYGWGLSTNLGKQLDVNKGVDKTILDRLIYIHALHERKVSIIGWSLGGIYARELARIKPELVRQVITMGTPMSESLEANHAQKLFEKTSGHKLTDLSRSFLKNLPIAPPVPTTAFYSITDGITNWHCCLEKPNNKVQNIEVFSSHCGLGHHPSVLWKLTKILSQKEDNWQLFQNMNN